MTKHLPTVETQTIPSAKVAKNIYYGTAEFAGQVIPDPVMQVCYYQARFISSLIRPPGYTFVAAQPVITRWAIGLPVQDRAFQHIEVGCHDLVIRNVDNVFFHVRVGFRDAAWGDGDPVEVSGQVGLTIYAAKQDA